MGRAARHANRSPRQIERLQRALRMRGLTPIFVRVPKPANSGEDKPRRELDCAVIQALHSYRKDQGEPPYDSVRALFPEDKTLYDNSGFRKRNHIQICVIKPENCIKGYFKPIKT